MARPAAMCSMMLIFVSVNPITTSLCHEAGKTPMHMIGCVSQGFIIIMFSKFWISDETEIIHSRRILKCCRLTALLFHSSNFDFFAKAYERWNGKRGEETR